MLCNKVLRRCENVQAVTGSDLDVEIDGLPLECKVSSYFIVGCVTRQHDRDTRDISVACTFFKYASAFSLTL